VVFEWKQICAGFLLFVYIYIVVGDPINWFNSATFMSISTIQTNSRVSECVIKRQFKQRWSTMQPISTIQTIASHLYSLDTKKGDNSI
jgi:hypothetical protein